MLVTLYKTTKKSFVDRQSKKICVYMGLPIIRADEWIDYYQFISIGKFPNGFNVKKLREYIQVGRLDALYFKLSDTYAFHPHKTLPFLKQNLLRLTKSL